MYLYSIVSPIRHQDVLMFIDRNSGGSVELAISFPIRAKWEEVSSVNIEYLDAMMMEVANVEQIISTNCDVMRPG